MSAAEPGCKLGIETPGALPSLQRRCSEGRWQWPQRGDEHPTYTLRRGTTSFTFLLIVSFSGLNSVLLIGVFGHLELFSYCWCRK